MAQLHGTSVNLCLQGTSDHGDEGFAMERPGLGDLVPIDGLLTDAVLSRRGAHYGQASKKAEVHLGFEITRSIRSKIFLPGGNGSKRLFVSRMVETSSKTVST